MKEPKEYRSQPVVIKAIQYTGNNKEAIKKFGGIKVQLSKKKALLVKTPLGFLKLERSAFLIRDVEGFLNVVSGSTFKKMYRDTVTNIQKENEQ